MPKRGEPDDPASLSSISRGMVWAHRVTSISLEMVIPAFIGRWLDQRWGTHPWLLVIGAFGGLALAMFHLIRLANSE